MPVSDPTGRPESAAAVTPVRGDVTTVRAAAAVGARPASTPENEEVRVAPAVKP